MVTDVKFARVTALPLTPQPNTIYFVKPNAASSLSIYVTGTTGAPVPLGIASDIVAAVVQATLTAGANITLTPIGGQLQIASTGGGGGSGGGDMFKSQNLSGLTSYPAARTNLGLAIGSDVQAFDADLAAIAALITTAFGRALLTLADQASARAAFGLTIGSDVQAYDADLAAIANLTTQAFGRSLLTNTDAASVRTALALASMALQDAANVAITGGSISGITDLALADGGTGASTAAAARTNLGVPAGSGTSTGTNTGDQTTITGNAGTSTALQTSRTINGVAFNGTANITVPAVDTATPRLALTELPLSVNFTAAADAYIPARVAQTISQGNAPIGTGTLAYAKSTAAAPSTFTTTTLPATLEAGAWLKVSATAVTGFIAADLYRSA